MTEKRQSGGKTHYLHWCEQSINFKDREMTSCDNSSTWWDLSVGGGWSKCCRSWTKSTTDEAALEPSRQGSKRSRTPLLHWSQRVFLLRRPVLQFPCVSWNVSQIWKIIAERLHLWVKSGMFIHIVTDWLTSDHDVLLRYVQWHFIHIYWFVSTSSLKTRECFSCVCWLKTLLKNQLPQFWKQQIGPTALQQEPWTPFRRPPREKQAIMMNSAYCSVQMYAHFTSLSFYKAHKRDIFSQRFL